METAAKFARAGDRILSFIVAIFVLLMLAYGGYSLWDTAMVYRGAFVSSDLLVYKPSGTGSDNPTLAELQQINPDVCAWLTIDDTHVDYPIVQGKDDMEYINKDVYGEFALSGSIFLASSNSPDFSDRYSLVYGHHMSNGAMFGDIVEFVDQAYFQEHQTGTLYLPGGTYAITLFACVETYASDSVIYNPNAYRSDTEALLSYIEANAVQYRDIGITAEDPIIGLSTCAEAQTNGRVVVFGRLDKQSQAQEGGA